MRMALVLLAWLCASAASAQDDSNRISLSGDPAARLEWMRAFASRGDDWINDIVPLSDDRFLVVGFLNRDDSAAPAARNWRALAAVVRGDGSGAADRHYGGSGINAFWSAREGEGERLFLAGFASDGGPRGIDALAIVTRADGAVEVERRFGGDGYDRFTSVAPAGDGFVFLGHSQLPGEERRRLYAVRTDRSLVPVWERIIDGTESIGALYIAAAPGGGFIVAGGISGGTQSDMLVLKLDDQGREQWRRTIGTAEADDVNHGLVVLADGRIVVVGYSRSWGARENDILAATLSRVGELLRREMRGGAGDDRPILAKADGQGGVVIVGHTSDGGIGGTDVLLARLDAQGRFAPGALVFGGAGDDHGTAIHPLADGSLLVAGYSSGPGSARQDAFLARFTAPSWSEASTRFTRREVP